MTFEFDNFINISMHLDLLVKKCLHVNGLILTLNKHEKSIMTDRHDDNERKHKFPAYPSQSNKAQQMNRHTKVT